MKRNFGNRDGFAIVYGLIVLFLASITGFSLLYISNKDKGTSVDYSKIRSAAVASRAGLTAFEGQCTKAPQEIVNIVNQYSKNHASKWLFGGLTSATAEQKVYFWSGSDAPGFSASIMKFDALNHLIQIEANGYGSLGGKKKTIGIYRLSGIDFNQAPKHAIYLDGEGKNFDVPIIINGDVYLRGDFHFNGNLNKSFIHGSLKTGDTNTVSTIDGSLQVDSNCYLQTKFRNQGTSSFKIYGMAGFKRDISTDAEVSIYKTAYFNSTINDNTGHNAIKMNSQPVFHSGLVVPASELNSPGSVTNTFDSIDISSKLGMKNGAEDPVTIDTSGIPASCIVNYPSIINPDLSDWNLTKLYNDQKAAGRLYNNFLVIRVSSGMNINTAGATFNGKVIWIIKSAVTCNGHWYKSGDLSNTLIYVTNGGSITGLGSAYKFRGYIYVTGTGSVIYSWLAGNHLYGAVHHVGSANTGSFQLNNLGAAWNIDFDTDVMNELKSAGVLRTPGGGGWPGSLVLSDTKIRLDLLSLYY